MYTLTKCRFSNLHTTVVRSVGPRAMFMAYTDSHCSLVSYSIERNSTNLVEFQLQFHSIVHLDLEFNLY